MVMFFVFLKFLVPVQNLKLWSVDTGICLQNNLLKLGGSYLVMRFLFWHHIWYVLLMGSLCAVWGTQHHMMCFVDDITVSSMRYSTSYNTFCQWCHCVCSVRYSTSYILWMATLCHWHYCVQCEVLSIIWYVLLMGSLSTVWGTQQHICFVDGVTECSVMYSTSYDMFCWWHHCAVWGIQLGERKWRQPMEVSGMDVLTWKASMLYSWDCRQTLPLTDNSLVK